MDIGTTIGHYKIIRPLGKGGMGEVYLAEDTKLKREVAIKVLPTSLRNDPDRLIRFRREAEAVAKLNHSNIAHVYTIEDIDNLTFIVMEYVPGKTLTELIPHDGMDLDSFFDTFLSLTDALAHAHDQGCIHRDLKPANIMVAEDGTAKILDFGLARLIDAESTQVTRESYTVQDIDSQAPTQTIKAEDQDVPSLTRGRQLMGTPMYMSPEQAEREDTDARTDIFSFGIVMYEALTGQRPFEGKTLESLIGRIVAEEPKAATTLRPMTPYTLWEIIRRCLRKDRDRRVQTALELHTDLQDVRDELQMDRVLVDRTTFSLLESETASPPQWRQPVVVTLFVLLVLCIPAVWFLKPVSDAPVMPQRIFKWPVPDLSETIISPDGKRLAYIADTRLWVRDMDNTEPREVPNTEGASSLFWSPQSDFLGYWTGNVGEGWKLWKVAAQGGPGIPICTLPVGKNQTGGPPAWGVDGRIIFGLDDNLVEVSAQGGTPALFLQPNMSRHEEQFFTPHFLPDGRTLLFGVTLTGDSTTVERIASNFPNAQDQAFVRSLESNARISYTFGVYRADGGYHILDLPGEFIVEPIFAPSGHLLYRQLPPSRRNMLWAIGFDHKSLAVNGEPFLVTPDSEGASIATDGTLVYHSDSALLFDQRHLAIVDRQGGLIKTIEQPKAGMKAVALSPDGRSAVVSAQEQGNDNLWIYDIESGVDTRLTFSINNDSQPDWSPDGKHIVFWSTIPSADLFILPSDGSGTRRELISSPVADVAPHWSRDGQYLAYHRLNSATFDRDLWYASLTEKDGEIIVSTTAPIRENPAFEALPQISPDGRYIAYQSNESGRWEIYVTRFPSGRGRWRVSSNGGIWPRWSPRGNELFFMGLTSDGQTKADRLMAAPVTISPVFRPSTPKPLFSGAMAGMPDVIISGLNAASDFMRLYDVSPDGQRFVVIQTVKDDLKATPTITVVQNWVK